MLTKQTGIYVTRSPWEIEYRLMSGSNNIIKVIIGSKKLQWINLKNPKPSPCSQACSPFTETK